MSAIWGGPKKTRGLTSRFAKPVCLSPARLVPLFAYLAKRRRVELDVRLEASEVALKVPEPFVQRAKVAAVPAQRLELCRVVGICESRSEEFALVDQGSESNLECRFPLVVEIVDLGGRGTTIQRSELLRKGWGGTAGSPFRALVRA